MSNFHQYTPVVEVVNFHIFIIVLESIEYIQQNSKEMILGQYTVKMVLFSDHQQVWSSYKYFIQHRSHLKTNFKLFGMQVV